MKPHTLWTHASLGLLLLLAGASRLRADITIRLSVKFILTPNGTMRPAAGDIGTVAGFDAQVARANQILAATGRGFRLQADYPGPNQGDIQPPVPSGEANTYWLELDARADGSRQQVEGAALANLASQATWKWDTNAINIYVNNTESGQCSFPGDGYTILWGTEVPNVTVLHEVGHFFGLQHTHSGDTKCDKVPPPYMVDNGDNLDSTIKDHNCIDSRDGLSKSNFNGRAFAELNAAEQARVNSSWSNVMSYHQEARTLLVDEQVDYVWTFWVNSFRNYVCSGRVWFVASFGDDTMWSGSYPGQAFRTIGKALTSVSRPDDVILIETPGDFSAPPGNVMNTPATLRAVGGPVRIVRAP